VVFEAKVFGRERGISSRILFSNPPGKEGRTLSNSPKHSGSASDFTIDDWLRKFGRMYGKRHEKHTTEYMISRLVEEVAELVNPMELQDRAQIAPNLADVFSWTCSIAYKLNIDLSTVTWEKYGMNAPRPKSAGMTSPQPTLQSFSHPSSLRDWQTFISKVYQEENARLSPMNALVAMMKDVGDLAMIHRMREPQSEVTLKLAAILAWTLTIAQLLQLDLSVVVNEKYDDHCPECGREICDTDVCHPFKTMFVSFGRNTSDEEKYVVLDSAAKRGFKTLVNPAPDLESTSELSTSIDLINNSDVACVILSTRGSSSEDLKSSYRQIFESLGCLAMLSKGDVWIFTKDPSKDLEAFLKTAFQDEGVEAISYADANHLKGLFDGALLELDRKREAFKS
jgi:NTP pyrophosphatase (non-canonical NTP hydrolase)